MITLQELKTYRSVNGDIDGLSRSLWRSHNDLSEEECAQLNELMQKLVICSRGLGSVDFCNTAQQEFHALAPSEEVRIQIEELVAEEASK